MVLCVQEHLEHRLAHRVHTGGLLGLLLEKRRPRHAHLLSQISTTHLLDKREHAAPRLHAPRSDVADRRELLALAHGELRAGPGLQKDVLHLVNVMQRVGDLASPAACGAASTALQTAASAQAMWRAISRMCGTKVLA